MSQMTHLMGDPTGEELKVKIDDRVSCPYNPQHIVPSHRLPWHITKCRQKVCSYFFYFLIFKIKNIKL